MHLSLLKHSPTGPEASSVSVSHWIQIYYTTTLIGYNWPMLQNDITMNKTYKAAIEVNVISMTHHRKQTHWNRSDVKQTVEWGYCESETGYAIQNSLEKKCHKPVVRHKNILNINSVKYSLLTLTGFASILILTRRIACEIVSEMEFEKTKWMMFKHRFELNEALG